MKRKILIFIFTFLPILVIAQEKLVKDFDNDHIKDTVYLDQEKGIIICQLSSQNFKKVSSDTLETLNQMSGIVEAKNGFAFFNDWMRAGFKSQFRYNKKLKKMQLIGMSCYEFGNAANDGSGEASVNLLTNTYIGNWNYYDHLANGEEGELVKIPTIKKEMKFPVISLESFSESTYFDFGDRSSELYSRYKEFTMQKRKRQAL